jgi:hypothetical protein
MRWVEIDERATGVPGIDCGIRLEKIALVVRE